MIASNYTLIHYLRHHNAGERRALERQSKQLVSPKMRESILQGRREPCVSANGEHLPSFLSVQPFFLYSHVRSCQRFSKNKTGLGMGN
jgi:hypothetical protein